MRCGDCRYWESPISFGLHRDWKSTMGMCGLMGSADGDPCNEHGVSSKATALDSEEHAAQVMCSADFGCIQFISK